jgi:hypothetical protein
VERLSFAHSRRRKLAHELDEETNMGEKLQQGDRFPSLTLKLVQGGTIRLPNEMPTRYAAVLFYRGHW